MRAQFLTLGPGLFFIWAAPATSYRHRATRPEWENRVNSMLFMLATSVNGHELKKKKKRSMSWVWMGSLERNRRGRYGSAKRRTRPAQYKIEWMDALQCGGPVA